MEPKTPRVYRPILNHSSHGPSWIVGMEGFQGTKEAWSLYWLLPNTHPSRKCQWLRSFFPMSSLRRMVPRLSLKTSQWGRQIVTKEDKQAWYPLLLLFSTTLTAIGFQHVQYRLLQTWWHWSNMVLTYVSYSLPSSHHKLCRRWHANLVGASFVVTDERYCSQITSYGSRMGHNDIESQMELCNGKAESVCAYCIDHFPYLILWLILYQLHRAFGPKVCQFWYRCHHLMNCHLVGPYRWHGV